MVFGAGDTASRTISVQTTQDSEYEPKEEKFILRLTGTYDGSTYEEEALGTIEDDERVTITIKPDPFTITEGTTGTLTFELSEAVPYQMLLRINDVPHKTSTKNVGDGGATMADYRFGNTFRDVTIEPGATTGTLGITALEDNLAEPDEKFDLNIRPFHRDSGNVKAGDYRRPAFPGSSISTVKTVTIEDNDSPPQGQRIVYLHGGAEITRITLKEGKGTTVTASLAGDAPSSDVSIPLKVTGYPANEVSSGDYSVPSSITIKSGEKSGTVNLRITNNGIDDRHHRLLAIEIDDASGSWPQGYRKGDRSRFEVVMEDNNRTPVNLQTLSRGAAEARNHHRRGHGHH